MLDVEGLGVDVGVDDGLEAPFPSRILGPFFGCPVSGSMGFAFVALARGGSGSWTVRVCFARASDRVKERSHSRSFQ